MTRETFANMLKEHPVILDGAMGSNLQKAGMPVGVCPEAWLLDHEDVLARIQKDYVKAGTQIIYAPTFTGNRVKLSEYGFGDRVKEINQRLISLTKQNVEGKAYVAGDLTMTGVSLEPIGPMKLDELIDIYKEQVQAQVDAGADLFVIETMMSLAETRAAVFAIREICDLPIMASLTYQEDGRTLYGTDPVTSVVVLQSIGVDAIGLNCSTGPAEMLSMLKEMKEYADVPLFVKPNAGLPVLVNGETVYPMGAEEFASYGPEFIKAGAAALGGCCGTNAQHIAQLHDAVKDLTVLPPCNRHPAMLASERKSQEICLDGPFLVIGERINPTGKKKLQAELRAGNLDIVEEMAEAQEKMGAHILDVNMGTSGIDEKEMMLKSIERITMVSNLPLCIDTSHVDIMEAALKAYPGRALINSISLEETKMTHLLPLVRKYGAIFILLPLSDRGLPESIQEKHEIIHTILGKARELGIRDDQIVVDGLVSTVGANPKAALETLETIRYCKDELGLFTSVGLSNISFGLPERSYVNGVFAAMCIQNGLTMAIANPSNPLLMGSAYAADLLMNKPESDIAYIEQVQRMESVKPVASVTANVKSNPGMVSTSADGRKDATGGQKSESNGNSADKNPNANMSGNANSSGNPNTNMSGNPSGNANSSGNPSGNPNANMSGNPVYEAVLKGNKKKIVSLVKEQLDLQIPPKMILNDMLIAGINEVGRLFDCQKYFLPQLISSANAMETAIAYLEPFLKDGEENGQQETIVIATVEGDVHDIGKNLVALMFKNYGYEVHDLGKDVPADQIIQAAETYHADIICLSALMTTTMMRMKDTVELRNQKQLKSKVIIGGAATTQGFADEIGADGYSTDAADAVKLVQKLLK